MTNKIFRFGMLPLIAALAAAVLSCPGAVSPPESTGTGTVRLNFEGVSVNAVKANHALSPGGERTLLPAAPESATLHFNLSFFQSGYETVTVNDWDKNSDITLGVGTWFLDVEAYLNDGENSIVVGTADDQAVVVEEGQATPVNVTLAPVTGEGFTGSFQYTVTLPDGASAAALELDSFPTPKGTDPAAVDLAAGETTSTIEDLAAGYYSLKVTYTVNGQAGGGVNKIVHIYRNLRTVYSQDFTENPNSPAPVIGKIIPGNGRLTVNWTAVGYASSYKVYYSTEGGPAAATEATAAGNATETKYQISGLTNGHDYHVWVKAVGPGGETSPFSAAATATPNKVTVAWTVEDEDNFHNGNAFDAVWTTKDAFEAEYGEGSVEVKVGANFIATVQNESVVDVSRIFLDTWKGFMATKLVADWSPYLDDDGNGQVSREELEAASLAPGISASFTAADTQGAKKIYGAGAQWSLPYYLYYNPALFTAYNETHDSDIQTPAQLWEAGNWNWTTFAQIARALTTATEVGPGGDYAAGDVQWGFATFAYEPLIFMAMNGVVGWHPGNVDVDAGAYDIAVDFNEEAAKEALVFLRGSYGYKADGAKDEENKLFNHGQDWFGERFRDGKIAMFIMAAPEGDGDGIQQMVTGVANVGQVPLPLGPAAGRPGWNGVAGVAASNLDAFCLTTKAVNPVGAAEFVKMSAKKFVERNVNPLVQEASKRSAYVQYAPYGSAGEPYGPIYGVWGDNSGLKLYRWSRYAHEDYYKTMSLADLCSGAAGTIVNWTEGGQNTGKSF